MPAALFDNVVSVVYYLLQKSAIRLLPCTVWLILSEKKINPTVSVWLLQPVLMCLHSGIEGFCLNFQFLMSVSPMHVHFQFILFPFCTFAFTV